MAFILRSLLTKLFLSCAPCSYLCNNSCCDFPSSWGLSGLRNRTKVRLKMRGNLSGILFLTHLPRISDPAAFPEQVAVRIIQRSRGRPVLPFLTPLPPHSNTQTTDLSAHTQISTARNPPWPNRAQEDHLHQTVTKAAPHQASAAASVLHATPVVCASQGRHLQRQNQLANKWEKTDSLKPQLFQLLTGFCSLS